MSPKIDLLFLLYYQNNMLHMWHSIKRGWTGGRGYGDKVGGIGGGGGGKGVEGAGSLERLGQEIDFFNRKFRENGSFRPVKL